ncbi:phosphatidylinositol N-acetylglucosaminyltransferase subunit C [Phlebotomus argentipes]|uniref:phosphatidylinositol N-acetylglucosaminyltransferase subunit C n=1 Tax=Phlebotomus argentipes TaxID=94469 RepID=UPI0028934343|nr:phosphatidylinositol N-acetylglucosaminyltransferase subunit C [Phlebotomus argentipes]
MTGRSKQKRWRKILYENQGFEDNYTPKTFLRELQKNRNVREFTFCEAVCGATKLSQQISVVVAFLIIYHGLFTHWLTPETVLLHSSVATVAGYALFLVTIEEGVVEALVRHSKTVLGVLVFGFIFSPLLHTLTKSISTDTIYSVTFFVFCLHLIFFDYGLEAHMVSRAISLNAAIFGSICLSSRLATSFHAFVLLATVVELFVLLPILQRRLWSPPIVLPTLVGCALLLHSISLPTLVTYALGLLAINILFPWLFTRAQPHKHIIHGPWDEAVVESVDF